MAAIIDGAARSRRVRESIQMSAMSFGFFPREFVWRGRPHAIRAVESCRTEKARGRVSKHVFRVRTDAAVLELAQDVARDAWRIEQIWAVSGATR